MTKFMSTTTRNSLGLLSLLSTIAFLSNEALACESTDAILKAAIEYDRGTGVCKGCLSYGPDVVTNKDGIQRANMVEYDLDLPNSGKYRIEVQYAAQQSRPVDIIVNGGQRTKGLGETTGGWAATTAEYFDQGIFEFKRGTNKLRFESTSVFPHIRKISISCIE